jgi:Flp pilus assembly protein TadG
MEEERMRTETDLHRRATFRGGRSRVIKPVEWMGKRRWIRRLAPMLADEAGQALIEFYMVLPLMLILTTGILMFGIAMNNYLALTNAVSIGARTVAVNAGLTLDPCSVASQAITAASPGLNSSKIKFTYVFNGVPASGTSCSSASVDSGAAGNLSSGSTVSVTATYPLNLSVFGGNYAASNAVLSATSTELVQ